MGYRIEYDSCGSKYEIRRENYFLLKIGFLMLLILALGLCLWPQGTRTLRSFLIPGEDAVTVQAFHTLTDDLRSGATIPDALEAFCQYVLYGH